MIYSNLTLVMASQRMLIKSQGCYWRVRVLMRIFWGGVVAHLPPTWEAEPTREVGQTTREAGQCPILDMLVALIVQGAPIGRDLEVPWD
jgi:hypothetical protein